MTRMIRGSVLLAACVGLWSCGTDSTSDSAGVPFQIRSLPSVVFVNTGESQLISFEVIDDLDGQIPATWTIANSSPNFTVGLDSLYRPVYNPDGTLTLPVEQSLVRATITGVALGISTFTVSAGGLSQPITVNVVPGSLNATFTPANPAPGELVTMTMPATLRLTPTSVITFPSNVGVSGLTIAADFMSATFISPPSTDTTATVTQVFNTEFPTIDPITLQTTTKVTGTQSGTWTTRLPATISPLVAGVVTVTLNPAYAFAPTSVFTFPTQTAPIVQSISADSTVATLAVGPNVASVLQVTNVTFKGAPQFVYTLVSADSVISPVISDFPATLDNYTPEIGEAVVLTAGAGFSFGPTATPTWPLSPPAVVLARTATTLTVMPAPGSGGSPAAVSGIIPASAPAFTLSIPAVLPTPLAMQATATSLPGTDDPATAPLIVFAPTANGIIDGTSTWVDTFCGYDCAWYKITVAAAGPVNFTLTWPNSDDLGLYFYDSILDPIGGGGCDAHGNGAGASPETCTITFPAAGTYYLDVEDFGVFYPEPQPEWVRIDWN